MTHIIKNNLIMSEIIKKKWLWRRKSDYGGEKVIMEVQERKCHEMMDCTQKRRLKIVWVLQGGEMGVTREVLFMRRFTVGF